MNTNYLLVNKKRYIRSHQSIPQELCGLKISARVMYEPGSCGKFQISICQLFKIFL